MTNKPTRRRATPLARATTESVIWSTIAIYANELAPVLGPLLEVIGKTAKAVERAENRTRFLEAELEVEDWD